MNRLNSFEKILILSPPFSSSGGVSSFIYALKGSWAGSERYFFRGNTGSNTRTRFLLMMKEYLLFFFECISFSGYNTILINTSMGKKAMMRDSIFILMAAIFQKKIILFIHGWDDNYFSMVSKNKCWFFFLSDKIFVLSNEFKSRLEGKGYRKEIVVETTVVENDFIKFFDNNNQKEKNLIRVLFLARLEPQKGVMLLIEAFKHLTKKHKNITLDIAGSGSLEKEVKANIMNHPNIIFHGLVTGKRKLELFKKAHIYVLPTSYGEGMPISVLEAMAAGLVVITSSAGALRDFFIDGVMGFKMEDVSAAKLEELLELALNEKEKGTEISRFNYDYARENVTVEKVSSRLQREILR